MAKTNDFRHDPILPLVLRLAIPTMLAQLISVLYSIVDRMYIGAGLGELALAGVGVCGPIVTLIVSFASLIGLGGSPNMAMRMGEGDKETASRVLSTAFRLLLVLAGVLMIVFWLLKGHLLHWFGASDATFPYANEYLSIYILGTFFALLSAGMNNFLICQGFPGLGMATVVLGAVLNIMLDPLFMFVFHWGVSGAAIATVLSQFASCVFVMLCLLRKKNPVPLRWRGFSWKLAVRISVFGLSPFLIIASDSVLLIILNIMLQRCGGPALGDTLVTCATIVQSYFLLITMPMGGMTLGCQPIISFNYGAGKPTRCAQAIKDVVGICVIFCFVMMILTHAFATYFVRLFTTNDAISVLAVRYIKIVTLMILPLAVQYALVDGMTALGKVRVALLCSMLRKTVFLLSVILLPLMFGAEFAFFAEPVCDIFAAIMTVVLFFRFIPPLFKRMQCNSPQEQAVLQMDS